MPDIRQLPPSVINKIAAGEVIERPASVVKELVENSVDAGATRIEVTLAAGGSELIRVADNGCGIAAEQLSLAIASHATSKIQDADDLFRVGTLGFRGEALASIAEISRFLIRSRTAESNSGAQLEVIGGQARAVEPCGCGVGTTIEVRDLFFNTPVRRKFMRAAQTEVSHATEAFTRIALAYPAVHFVLRNNERIVYDLPPTTDWRDRIATFFGADVGAGLIPIDAEDGGVRLFGYVANPHFSRGNNRLQYLFLNGRCIRDRSLQHALGEAYRGLLLTGRFPIAFLRLEMPADMVDVNVHPTKLEVRFQDSGRIYSQLLGALRRKFLSTDLTATVQSATATSNDASSAHDVARAEQLRRELVGWAQGQIPSSPDVATGVAVADQPQLDFRFDRGSSSAMPSPSFGSRVPPFQPFDAPPGGFAPRGPAGSPHSAESSFPPAPSFAPSAASPATTPAQLIDRGLQLHNRYLVTENDFGIVVIDQHALHERILYEQLRAKVLAGQMETQRLLVPEPVSLTPAEAAAALEARESLRQLGIDIEPFGGDTILVTSYPAMLANLGPAEVLRQVVEQLLAGGKQPDRRDLVDELLHMISCKAAIKAGDHLSPEEVSALLEQRHLFHDTHHCPHGRPTALVFTKEELDKRFKRI